MVSKRRHRSIILPRQIAMYLASVLTSHSSGYIGVRFGRDHSTVLHAVEKIGNLIAEDAQLAEDIGDVKRDAGVERAACIPRGARGAARWRLPRGPARDGG